MVEGSELLNQLMSLSLKVSCVNRKRFCVSVMCQPRAFLCKCHVSTASDLHENIGDIRLDRLGEVMICDLNNFLIIYHKK